MRNVVVCLACFVIFNLSAQVLSKTWVADQSNGTYKNPILYADYSDPDVCRVGDDFFMTASSFNCVPGLPILHSNDLVNWTLVGHALQHLIPDSVFSKVVHGGGVWAPSIRYHKGEYYIYFGDPDYGIYMTKTKDPSGIWDPLVLVKSGKGLIDACPLFDDDGSIYLAHAYAGSRAGIKSVIAVTALSADGTHAVGTSHIVYDGHLLDPTIEGAKFYKRNGYYYIFAPAGGVSTGWQVVLRSKDVWGPYERKVVMHQGNTKINGPHQGAWIDTPLGENWFVHFQDVGAMGRVTLLQPLVWKNDWPVIGLDHDGDGCGDPVSSFKKPHFAKTYPIVSPAEDDEFSSSRLGLQWQWHANPQDWWCFPNSTKGCLTLFSVPVPKNYTSLWDVPNLLLQKTPAPQFTVTLKLTFNPDSHIVGERTGLMVMGMDYGVISLESTEQGFVLAQSICEHAEKGAKELISDHIVYTSPTVFFRVKVDKDMLCHFSYSSDNKNYVSFGKSFRMREGKWIGAKIGTFCTRPVSNNDGGSVDLDWIHFSL